MRSSSIFFPAKLVESSDKDIGLFATCKEYLFSSSVNFMSILWRTFLLPRELISPSGKVVAELELVLFVFNVEVRRSAKLMCLVAQALVVLTILYLKKGC